MHVKKGQTVKILAGKDRGKTGKIISAFPKEAKVIVEGINLSKRHQRARKSGQSGQILEKAMPVHISNVALAKTKAKAGNKKKTRPEKK